MFTWRPGRAVAFALSLARETDGELTLLYVVEPVPASGEFGALDVEEYRRLGEVHARKVLTEAVAPDVLPMGRKGGR